MAKGTDIAKQSTAQMAESQKLYNGKKHKQHNQGVGRQRHVTAEQKGLIRQMYAAGKTGHEIARELGLGSTTVYNHLALGNKKKPRWSYEENQIVVDGYAQKKSVKEIAERLGRSEQAVILHMYWHRQKVRSDPKKRRALSAISRAFKAVRKADIFRELE